MRTARSLTVLTGATTHAPPRATMHTPLEQPRMPPGSNHACPRGATMYAPQSNHACPLWTECGHILPRGSALGGSALGGVSALGVSAPGECLLQGISAPGGVCSGWSAPRGVSAPGLLPGAVCSGGRGYPSMHWGRHPPDNRMTDTCKNITLPQLRCGR